MARNKTQQPAFRKTILAATSVGLCSAAIVTFSTAQLLTPVEIEKPQSALAWIYQNLPSTQWKIEEKKFKAEIVVKRRIELADAPITPQPKRRPVFRPAPKRVIKVTQQSRVQRKPIVSELSEKEKMRGIHFALRRNFALALNTRLPKVTRPKEIATRTEIEFAPVSNPRWGRARSVSRKPVRVAVATRPVTQVDRASVEKQKARRSPVNTLNEMPMKAKSSELNTQKVTQDQKALHYNGEKLASLAKELRLLAKVDIQEDIQFQKNVGPDPPPDSKNFKNLEKSKEPQGSFDFLGVQKPKINANSVSIVAKNTPVISSVSSQKEVKSVDHSTEYSSDSVPGDEYSVSVSMAHPSGKAIQALYVEAFKSDSIVEDWKEKVLSYEGHRQRSRKQGSASGKWVVTSSPQYWKTLAWHPDQSIAPDREERIPLLSETSALLLSRLIGSKLQKGTGIIYGRLLRGWSLQFSGRAEAPLLFDKNGARLDPKSEADRVRARTFVYVNVSPGAHLIYLDEVLNRGQRGRSGAVGFPVLSGAMTYLDLRKSRTHTLQGRVLDGSSDVAETVSQVKVTPLGQSGSHTFSGPDGAFQLDQVVTFFHYPVYLETETPGGFKHRYRIRGDQTQGIQLFHFANEQIEEWVGQLDGGLSPESGLVISALPGVSAMNGDEPLYPNLYSLRKLATLDPETYALSSEGQLLVRNPLEITSPRFVSVQVPEGPAIAELTTRTDEIVWSEFLVASPGVVNVMVAE